MLVEFNQALQNNDCVVEHVYCRFDGKAVNLAQARFRKDIHVIKTERPIGQRQHAI